MEFRDAAGESAADVAVGVDEIVAEPDRRAVRQQLDGTEDLGDDGIRTVFWSDRGVAVGKNRCQEVGEGRDNVFEQGAEIEVLAFGWSGMWRCLRNSGRPMTSSSARTPRRTM